MRRRVASALEKPGFAETSPKPARDFTILSNWPIRYPRACSGRSCEPTRGCGSATPAARSSAPSGRLIKRLTEHASPVFTARFSQDGSLLASGDFGGTVVIRSMTAQGSGSPRSFRAHERTVRELRFLNADVLVSVGSDGARAWSLPTDTALVPALLAEQPLARGVARAAVLHRWTDGHACWARWAGARVAAHRPRRANAGRCSAVCGDRQRRRHARRRGRWATLCIGGQRRWHSAGRRR